MKFKLISSAAAFVVIALITTATAQAADTKPNVVFILADNVGYGDLGPYGGGELRGCPTPRIDQLAREGLRLTQYLVEPACTPSRAALMTGQYSIRNGLSLIILPGSPNSCRNVRSPWASCSRARLCDGDLRQVAPWRRTAELADSARLRRVLRHSAGHLVGFGTYVDTIMLTHSIHAPFDVLLAKGPHIFEAVAGGPLTHAQAVHAGSPGRDRQ